MIIQNGVNTNAKEHLKIRELGYKPLIVGKGRLGLFYYPKIDVPPCTDEVPQ